MTFSNQPVDSSNTPIASVYVPGSGFVATSGSINTNTDGLSNTFTDVNVNIDEIGGQSTSNIMGIDDSNGSGLLKTVPSYRNADGGYDEMRGNQDTITLINASGVTTTQTSAQQVNFNGRGALVIVNCIDMSANPSLTLSVQGVEPVTGATWNILVGTTLTANGVYVYRIYPGLIPITWQTVNDILPRTWQVVMTAGNANAATYKACCVVML